MAAGGSIVLPFFVFRHLLVWKSKGTQVLYDAYTPEMIHKMVVDFQFF